MEITGIIVPWRQTLTLSWCKASMSWQELQVVVCFKGCCLLALRGNGVTEQFFSPRPFLLLLSWHIYAIATFASYLRAFGEGSSDVHFSSTQESLSCRLGAWKLLWGGADAPNWSCGGVWCVLWCCAVGGLKFWAVLALLLGRKREGVSVSLLICCFSSIPSFPLGLSAGEDGRARSEVLCYTVIILSKVFSVIWIFSTTAKWTPAFKNQSVAIS